MHNTSKRVWDENSMSTCFFYMFDIVIFMRCVDDCLYFVDSSRRLWRFSFFIRLLRAHRFRYVCHMFYDLLCSFFFAFVRRVWRFVLFLAVIDCSRCCVLLRVLEDDWCVGDLFGFSEQLQPYFVNK